ncbi:hypothetical protein C6497_09085 [Candidatus Poribacteria bacterium]|nr:MAG: hypothetical protein C6497_09085 [Candidatus Poribacteria bacterium]
MKRLTLTTLFVTICFFGSTYAQTNVIRGKIDMKLPNNPTPTIEVSLDQSFFNLFINFTLNLPEFSEYAEMIDGIYIQSYDKQSPDLKNMKNEFQKTLKTENWEQIVKVKDELYVSMLFDETPGVLNGIFISFTEKQNTTFVNIFGEIDFQKLGVLFAKIMETSPDFMKKIKIDANFANISDKKSE